MVHILVQRPPLVHALRLMIRVLTYPAYQIPWTVNVNTATRESLLATIFNALPALKTDSVKLTVHYSVPENHSQRHCSEDLEEDNKLQDILRYNHLHNIQELKLLVSHGNKAFNQIEWSDLPKFWGISDYPTFGIIGQTNFGFCEKEWLSSVDQSKDVVVAITAVDLTSASASATPPKAPQEKATYRNLAVKSKAVYQPHFKFQRWMEGQKKIVPPGESISISDIECGLPALHGENASVINYVKELAKVDERLERFYNGNDMIYKRHKWDAKRAKDREFLEIANSLLKVVGGNIGELRKDGNKVVIATGLGQFTGTPGLTSVHSSFLTYFVRKRDQSSALIDEWNRWLLDLKNSSYEVVRRAAVTASALTQDDIDEYYRDRVSVDREHDALESSRKQLRVTDQQLTLRMEKRQVESTHSMSSLKDDSIQEIAQPVQGSTTANSTTSTAGTSAAVISAGRAGLSSAITELSLLPNASTTPPGTPPSLAASPSHLGYPPPILELLSTQTPQPLQQAYFQDPPERFQPYLHQMNNQQVSMQMNEEFSYHKSRI
ncbi:unnamed protein product [Mortierella alpina]